FKQGINSISRIINVLKIIYNIWKNKEDKDVIYFTISQSYAGNLKDILIYLACYKQLSKMIIHLHGGAGMRNIMSEKNKILHWLNTFFLNKMGAIIILGNRHADIYAGINDQRKIHIVPNFAQTYLFTNTATIQHKFENTKPLKILFLSNLLPSKGHIELVQAFLALDETAKSAVEIDFAGGFESKEQETSFLKMSDGFKQVRYHGKVEGEQKKKLFIDAHVFCLPTYYPYEGQPISILEAYATGCAVITTDHSGIYDVFTDGVNGFGVSKKSYLSLKSAIEKAIGSTTLLRNFAMNNLITAQNNYTTDNYNSNLMVVINSVYSDIIV
ncbi:hypothetical protein BCS42_02590, partial [Crenothrix sp. D3]